MFVLSIISLLLLHIPFLNADADISLALGSRGAWTDEGLYTAPIRNLVNHGYQDFIIDNTTLKIPYLIVTPLYSLYLYPFFKFFGISLCFARFVTILTMGTTLYGLFKNQDRLTIGFVFIATTMLFFPIFQYTHLCLAEIYSTILITTALLYFAYSRKSNITTTIIVFLLLILAVLFKIQFIYILAIPVILSGFSFVFLPNKENRKQLVFAFLCTVVIVLGVYLIWYLPFKGIWLFTINNSASSLSAEKITISLISGHLHNFFFSKKYLLFTILFLVSFTISIYHIWRKNLPATYIKLISVCLVWFLVELHKLGLSYLPIRYLISFYASMGLLISVVFGYYITNGVLKNRIAVVFGILLLIITNIYMYSLSYKNRSFAIQNANTYLKSIVNENDIVIGPWAPSLTWETGSKVFPIWNIYIGKNDIIKYYNPSYIISEAYQEDSDSAYARNNIILSNCCDSLKQFKIANWELKVYKLKH